MASRDALVELPVAATTRVRRTLAEQTLLRGRAGAGAGRPRPQPRQHDAAARVRPHRGDDPRPDLHALPGGARGRPGARRARCSCRSRRAARTAGHRRVARRRRTTCERFLHVPAEQGRRGAERARARSRPSSRRPTGALRERLGLRRGRSCSRPPRTPAQEPRAPDRRDARPSTRRSCCPATRRPFDAALRERADGGARRADRLADRRRHGGALPRRDLPRLPVARRGLRPAGARGDAPRRAGGVRARDARCRSWRATPRCCSTRSTPTRSRRRCGGWSRTTALRRELAARGRERAARFSWERGGGGDRGELPQGARVTDASTSSSTASSARYRDVLAPGFFGRIEAQNARRFAARTALVNNVEDRADAEARGARARRGRARSTGVVFVADHLAAAAAQHRRAARRADVAPRLGARRGDARRARRGCCTGTPTCGCARRATGSGPRSR